MGKKILLLASTFLATGGTGGLKPSGASASAAAIRQAVEVVSVSDHCIDEFDEDLIIYVNEGAKDCKVTIRVKGRGTVKSKVILEYLDSEEGWVKDTDNKPRLTSAAGRATFLIGADFPTDPDSTCYEGDSFSYRFAVATTGRFRSFRSATFEVVYTSADDNPACNSYDGYDDSLDE